MATQKQRDTARRNLAKARDSSGGNGNGGASRSPKQRASAKRNLTKARTARSSRGRSTAKSAR